MRSDPLVPALAFEPRHVGAPRAPARRLVGLVILAELLLFASAGFLAYRFVGETRASREWVDHSHQVIRAFAELRLIAQRLTVDTLYFAYGEGAPRAGGMLLGIDEVERRVSGLRALVADDPAQVRRLDALGQELEARLALHRRLVAEVRAGDVSGARPIVADLEREDGRIRTAIDAFEADEQQKLEARDAASDATLRRILLLLAVAFVGAFLFGAAATLLFLNRSRLQRSQWTRLAGANTEIARQNEAARSAQRRLNAVLDNARDGIMLLSPERTVTMANGACAALLRLPPDQVVGRQVTDFLPGFAAGDGEPWRKDAVRGDGSAFPAEVSAGPCQLDDGPATVCVMRDVSERQRLERLKDDFVSTVSHELRTPLTSIRGSLGLVLGGAAGELPPKAKALLEIADKNGERLIDLVNDLLDIEKIETHSIAMRRDRVEVRGLVRAAVEANQAFARQFLVEVRVSDDAPPCGRLLVLGDMARLQQVLTNLLSNAVKFSPRDGRVVVSIASDPAWVTVSVRDSGAGIPDEFKPHLFKRFAQAEHGDAKRTKGTGLGLSLVKAIVERHGGALGFESPASAAGGGTRFWFRLPRLAEEQGDGAEDDQRPRVLVCEDNAIVAHFIEVALAKDGWRTTAVPTAEDALAQLAAHRFAAMTVDLRLPAMSGGELIRRVAADERHGHMPIVVVSVAGSEHRGELDGYAGRLLDWVEKPFDERELRRALLDARDDRRRCETPRILHVEDDPDVAAVVREVIGEAAQVERAASLHTARELLAQRRFDLVILDVRLPDGNGLDLAPLLRSRHAHAALLVLSAEGLPEDGFEMVHASLTKAQTDNARPAQTVARLLGQVRENGRGGSACRQTG